MNNRIKFPEEMVNSRCSHDDSISNTKSEYDTCGQIPEPKMKIGEMIETLEAQQNEINAITNEIELRFTGKPKLQTNDKTRDQIGYEGRLIDIIEINRTLIWGLSNILDSL